MASSRAENVYAVENNRNVYERGKEILAGIDTDTVEFMHADARSITFPGEIDVVICEMLDTGLIAELQVPVMNHAVSNFLSPTGSVIPYKAKTSVQLINSDYTFYGKEFRLPHFEAYGSREAAHLSEKKVYHKIDFTEKNSLQVDEKIILQAVQNGVVNGIQLNTDVMMSKGQEYTGGSAWLDPPLNLPIDEDISVQSGDEVEIILSYELGGGLDNVSYKASP